MNDVMKSDYIKWGGALLILCIGVFANDYYAHVSPLIRSVGWIIFAAVLIGIAMTTQHGRLSLQYIKASRAEVRKVVWPTRQVTLQLLLVVALMVVIIALIIFAFDQVFSWLMNWLLG